MNRLLALSSALALLGAPALAQAPSEDPAANPPAAEPAPALEADEAAIDTDADGDLEVVKNGWTDIHDWVGVAVYANGEQIGEIERVHLGDDVEVDSLVVETGGIAEVGGREVQIGLDQAELMTDANGENAFSLKISAEEFAALPDFDESLASDYPLSDNPFEEDTVSGEGDLGDEPAAPLEEDNDLIDDAADDHDADDDVL